jgi:hypothetical protein
MPLKLNVGLARKVGEANYSSRGASVNMELEVDGSLANEPDKLHDRIRRMFTLVRNSLEEELHGGNGAPAPSNGKASNGNGQQNGASPGRMATTSQVKALHAIAKNRGLTLVSFLRSRFQLEKPEALSLRQASAAIDELKNGGDN